MAAQQNCRAEGCTNVAIFARKLRKVWPRTCCKLPNPNAFIMEVECTSERMIEMLMACKMILVQLWCIVTAMKCSRVCIVEFSSLHFVVIRLQYGVYSICEPNICPNLTNTSPHCNSRHELIDGTRNIVSQCYVKKLFIMHSPLYPSHIHTNPTSSVKYIPTRNKGVLLRTAEQLFSQGTLLECNQLYLSSTSSRTPHTEEQQGTIYVQRIVAPIRKRLHCDCPGVFTSSWGGSHLAVRSRHRSYCRPGSALDETARHVP